MVSACVAAYGFGRFDFPGRKLMFNIMLATLFLPQVVLNVPQYLLYNKFGWLDSPFYLAIWVHCAFATETYFVYQLVQFMRSIPHDLDEAAAIDGCGPVKILYKIICPMLSPSLVAVRCSSSCGAATTLWVPCFTLLPRANTPWQSLLSCLWTVPVKAFSGTASLPCP